MTYKIKRPVSTNYIPLSNRIERMLDLEWIEENKTIDVGVKVKLRDDVLVRHARSVPAHAGYTKEQFVWREVLAMLKGKTGIVSRVFTNSTHVNVDFKTTTIGIDRTELVKVE